MIKLKIFKAEFTESKVAFKKVAFLGKWLKPLFSTCKRKGLKSTIMDALSQPGAYAW